MSDIHNLEIDVDLKENLIITATCKQLDDLNLIFNVWNNGEIANLTEYKCRLKAFKQDQIPLIQNTSININNNVVNIIADEQLTTTSGIVKVELQFISKNTGKKKSTFNIVFKVIQSVLEVERSISKATCTLLKEIDNKLDRIEDIGDVLEEAKDVRDTLINTTIPGATNINSKLESNIKNASDKIVEVESSITNASKKIEEVEASTKNANSSKEELDLSKTNADISKENLDAANVQAEKNIEELNKLGDVTDLAKNVQTNTTDITNLKEDVENNSSQLKDCAKNIGQLSNPNILINGDFQVWQRGTSFTFDANKKYSCDRWGMFEEQFKTGNGTVSKFGKEFLIRPSEINTYHYVQQSLENSISEKLRGKKVTISAKIRTANALRKLDFLLAFSNVGEVGLGSGTSESRKSIEVPRAYNGIISYTITVPNDTKGIAVVIGSSFNDITDLDYLAIEYIKLELGEISTPLVLRGYGEEEMLCKRYYRVKSLDGILVACDEGQFTFNLGGFQDMRIKPTMRFKNKAFLHYSDGSVPIEVTNAPLGTDNGNAIWAFDVKGVKGNYIATINQTTVQNNLISDATILEQDSEIY